MSETSRHNAVISIRYQDGELTARRPKREVDEILFSVLFDQPTYLPEEEKKQVVPVPKPITDALKGEYFFILDQIKEEEGEFVPIVFETDLNDFTVYSISTYMYGMEDRRA